MQQLFILGSEQIVYGESLARGIAGVHAWLSIGSSAYSPSVRNKVVPNEDALLIAEHEGRLLLAVADGHFGTAAHDVIRQLAERLRDRFPRRLPDLSLLLLSPFQFEMSRSGTTLTVALVDQDRVQGFAFGDSLLLTAGADGCRQRCTPNENYLHSDQEVPLHQVAPFVFTLASGESLMLCTDGVNECCYRQPDLSLNLADLMELYEKAGAQSEEWGRLTLQSALHGVRGASGGQDNIAIITCASRMSIEAAS